MNGLAIYIYAEFDQFQIAGRKIVYSLEFRFRYGNAPQDDQISFDILLS